MTTKQVFALIIWTVICIAADILIYRSKTQALVYDVQTQVRILIESKNYTINTSIPLAFEGASSDHFRLENTEQSDMINGEPVEKPLGWPKDTYYYVQKNDSAVGKWEVEEITDNIEIRLTTQQPTIVTMELTENGKCDMLLKLVMISLIPWFGGILIYSMVTDR